MKNDKNFVNLKGTLEKVDYSHQSGGKMYYKTYIDTRRKSGTVDRVPVIVSEDRMNNAVRQGAYVEITGVFASRNRPDENSGKKHLDLFVNANVVEEVEETEDLNKLVVEGTVCKPTVGRVTPAGRKVADMFIAVNRNKSSYYFPCSLWGDTAEIAKKLEVGEKVKLIGRIQSRKYIKKISKNESIEKEAYEISSSCLEVVKC